MAGDKCCKILNYTPLLALNFTIETSFCCTFFLIFSAIVQNKRPFFSSGQVSYCHHWASVVRPSVNFSHFNQLLWSRWANLNQTLVEWSLDGPLPKLCPVIPTSNQDGRHAKNRKKGGWNLIVHCCISISLNELKF
jgi:hypothetical protein